MNSLNARQWAHHFMPKIMGLLFIIAGMLIMFLFVTQHTPFEDYAMIIGSLFLLGGGLLCAV